MTATTSDSQPLKQEIDALTAAKQALQTELRNSPASQRPFFADIIRNVNQELYGKQDEFRRLLEAQSEGVLGPLIASFDEGPFTATFDGTVTIEIDHSDDDIRGPHEVTFTSEDDTPTLRLQFEQTSVEVVELTPVKTEPHDTPVGMNTTTVRRIVNEGRQTGSFDGETGRVELPLDLFFDNSVSAPFVEPDAPVNFDLSTEGVSAPVGDYKAVDLGGTPLNPETMEFKAVDESMFEDISSRHEWSILGGRNVVLSAEGKLASIAGPPLDVVSSVSFGQVVVGDVRTRSISIRNNTGSNVTITIPTSPTPPTGPGAPGLPTFSWSPTGTHLLRRGEEMQVHVTFAPAANEQAQTTLTITGSDTGSPHSITLRGTGIGGPGNGGGNGGDVHPF